MRCAVTCPRCRSVKSVDQDAVDEQLEEDGAYQCSTCKHRFDPYGAPVAEPGQASAAVDPLQSYLGQPPR